MPDFKELGWSVAGSEGRPGDYYEVASAVARRLDSGRTEIVISFERGSNQGHLEPHRCDELSARGEDYVEAIDKIRSDVVAYDDWLTPQSRNQLLRDLEHDIEDNLRGTLARGAE